MLDLTLYKLRDLHWFYRENISRKVQVRVYLTGGCSMEKEAHFMCQLVSVSKAFLGIEALG